MTLASRGKPSWLRMSLPVANDNILGLRSTLRKHGMVTVCEESHCPNIPECWNGGTATFMVLGDTCTRGCRFCNVSKARLPPPADPLEPEKLAKAVAELNLDYVVITSVDRDDLPDQGAEHFASCIREIKKSGILVEVLIPDFRGDSQCLERVVKAGPDVLAHNLETVKRLQHVVRDRRAGYEQSLNVLAEAKKINPSILSKSSIIVGFGETEEEMLQAMADLRTNNVDFLTIGQYLRPSIRHIEVKEYVPPEKFEFYRQKGEEMGFKYVASGPYVRSSFRAGELFVNNILKKVAE